MTDETRLKEFESQVHRRRKNRDMALVLPISGVFLLATPVVSAFTGGAGGREFLQPVTYLFGVWFLLIVLAAFLARRLANDGPAD